MEGEPRQIVPGRFPAAGHLTAATHGRHTTLLAGIRAGGNNPCGLPGRLRSQWRQTQERWCHLSRIDHVRLPLRGQRRLGNRPEGPLPSCFPFNLADSTGGQSTNSGYANPVQLAGA